MSPSTRILFLCVLALSSSSLTTAMPSGGYGAYTPAAKFDSEYETYAPATQQTETYNATPRPSEASRPFYIRHRLSGLCFHPKGGEANSADNTEIVLYKGCSEPRLQFEYNSATQTIKHVSSGKCFAPARADAANDTPLVLTSQCDSDINKFQWNGDSIQHVQSGKCLHPWGGWNHPGSNTPMHFFEGCGMERIRFDRITVGI